MGKYFGTDGFRGKANEGLTAQHAYEIGRFLGWYYGRNERAKIVVGKDTRRSSYMLEYALSAGITASGADAYLLHVTTTPSVSYVTRTDGFDCGVMISASHNPYYDNGIKLMNREGEKMDETTISLVEDYLDGRLELDGSLWTELPLATEDSIGAVVDHSAGRNRYMGYLISLGMYSFKGKKVALDCANGSAWSIAPHIFEALGAEVSVINNRPNGLNINDNAGSTHIGGLQKYVVEHGMDVGFAYDGDADRCLAVDENGCLVDGDFVMAICAADMKSRGKLEKSTVVGTIMTNMGFNRFCDQNDMHFAATKVGDRYVLEEMLLEGYNFGGEQSGHVIFLDFATTGDGQMTAAQLLSIMRRREAKLSSLATVMQRYPQVMVNVTTSPEGKLRFYTDAEVKECIEKAKTALGKSGRIVVRPSGTEPLLRVMVEGEDEEQISVLANQVADVLRTRLA